MTKRTKFPLKMTDGAEVRTLEQLKEHFDIDSVTEYFFDGRLLTWLEDRYYDAEAEAIKKLFSDDERLEQKICKIFDMETPEEIARRERLNRLKKYTDDKKILVNVDKVAFDQEDLAYLLDEDAKEIFLCANRFVIPLRMKNKNYIGVGKAIAIIRSKEFVDFDKLNIKFKNVAFDDDYQKILPKISVKTKSKAKNNNSTEKPKQKLKTATKTYACYEATTVVENRCGFHARPVSNFVQKASSFKSKVQLKAKGRTVDAKSILMVMGLGLTRGTEITIFADGSDAEDAVKTLKGLVDNRCNCPDCW